MRLSPESTIHHVHSVSVNHLIAMMYCKVESNGNKPGCGKVSGDKQCGPGCNMDVGSCSCGPYQIKAAYFQDCSEHTTLPIKSKSLASLHDYVAI